MRRIAYSCRLAVLLMCGSVISAAGQGQTPRSILESVKDTQFHNDLLWVQGEPCSVGLDWWAMYDAPVRFMHQKDGYGQTSFDLKDISAVSMATVGSQIRVVLTGLFHGTPTNNHMQPLGPTETSRTFWHASQDLKTAALWREAWLKAAAACKSGASTKGKEPHD